MSKLNFVGLSGMTEIGGKMYVLEIEEEIYVFDAGMNYPEDAIFGIDKIIPDMTYLKNNRKRIKGIFISNISDANIGALVNLLEFVQAPIFGSEFTISCVKKEIMNKNQEYKIIHTNKKTKIGKITVTAFPLTYSLPGNYGFFVETLSGNIVYISDFVFNQNVPHAYQTDFAALSSLSNKKVVAMAMPVKGAEKNSYGETSVNFHNEINALITEADPLAAIFVNVFTKNFLAIQTVIDAAIKNKKQICIIGKKGYDLIQSAIKSKVLSVPKDVFVHVKQVTEETRDNIVFLVLGDEGVPYELMLHILSDTHRDVRVQQTDLVVIAVPNIAGSELRVSAVIDSLFTKGINTSIIHAKEMSFDISGSEDMKMLYNIVKPKYLITTDAEYRQMIAFKSQMVDFGVNEKAILFADAGEWISFENGLRVKSDKTDLTLEKMLVDGNLVQEDNDNIILQEREQLSSDGVAILTVALLEKNGKYTAQYINFKSKGFIPEADQKTLVKEINSTVINTVEKMNTENNVKIATLKKKIQEAINQTIYRQIKRYPIVVVQFVMQ